MVKLSHRHQLSFFLYKSDHVAPHFSKFRTLLLSSWSPKSRLAVTGFNPHSEVRLPLFTPQWWACRHRPCFPKIFQYKQGRQTDNQSEQCMLRSPITGTSVGKGLKLTCVKWGPVLRGWNVRVVMQRVVSGRGNWLVGERMSPAHNPNTTPKIKCQPLVTHQSFRQSDREVPHSLCTIWTLQPFKSPLVTSCPFSISTHSLA